MKYVPLPLIWPWHIYGVSTLTPYMVMAYIWSIYPYPLYGHGIYMEYLPLPLIWSWHIYGVSTFFPLYGHGIYMEYLPFALIWSCHIYGVSTFFPYMVMSYIWSIYLFPLYGHGIYMEYLPFPLYGNSYLREFLFPDPTPFIYLPPNRYIFYGAEITNSPLHSPFASPLHSNDGNSDNSSTSETNSLSRDGLEGSPLEVNGYSSSSEGYGSGVMSITDASNYEIKVLTGASNDHSACVSEENSLVSGVELFCMENRENQADDISIGTIGRSENVEGKSGDSEDQRPDAKYTDITTNHDEPCEPSSSTDTKDFLS